MIVDLKSTIINHQSSIPTMSTAAILPRSSTSVVVRPGLPFALAALVTGVLSAVLAGWLPLGFSIVTVFLFAGPHNWLELRYFMGRMPARWGRLRGYFLFAFAGIFGLSAAWITIGQAARIYSWDDAGYHNGNAIWNSVFAL